MNDILTLAGQLFFIIAVLAFCGVGFKHMQPATSSTPVKDGIKFGIKAGFIGALTLFIACIGASSIWLWLN